MDIRQNGFETNPERTGMEATRKAQTTAQAQLLVLMRTEFARLQSKNRSFSLRAFAKRLNLVPSATSEILNGKREASPEMAEKILKGLHADPDTMTKILSRLNTQKTVAKTAAEAAYHQVQMDQYHVIADWYYFAILSLAETEGFDDSPDSISERLNVPKVDVVRALERLERLELLVRRNGRLRPTGKQFETSRDVVSLSLRKSHTQSLEMANASLMSDPVDVRDFGAMTMAIDPDLLPEAKEMIRDFRKKLSAFLESGKKKEVYRFSTILFPLTKGQSK